MIYKTPVRLRNEPLPTAGKTRAQGRRVPQRQGEVPPRTLGDRRRGRTRKDQATRGNQAAGQGARGRRDGEVPGAGGVNHGV